MNHIQMNIQQKNQFIPFPDEEYKEARKLKKYEFHCGGDRGAWECDVTVSLTDEEEACLKEYAKDERNEFLGWYPPVDKIWSKAMKALEDQCDEDAELNDVVIWIPFKFRS